jgi:dolichol kinase
MNHHISYIAEIQRKLFHFLIILFPITYLYLGKTKFLLILLPLSALIIGLDYYRHHNEKFAKLFSTILRKHETEHGNFSGTSYMAMSACLTFGLFPKMLAVNAFTILALSDSLAALVGRGIKSKKFYEKSVAGSATFFITALAILIFHGIYFYQPFYYYIFGLAGVFTATMIEARPSLLDNMDDNLTIPLAYCIATFMFEILWIYHF